MISIRPAKQEEAEILTDIAANSEAYWGYDEEYMQNFRSIYKVTDEFIRDNTVCVIEENSLIVGFYGVITDKCEALLEYFYITPECIGKGYGKAMWKHLIYTMEKKIMNKINLVTSPQAKDFYIKMGAQLIGEIDSLVIENRKIPQLVYKL